MAKTIECNLSTITEGIKSSYHTMAARAEKAKPAAKAGYSIFYQSILFITSLLVLCRMVTSAFKCTQQEVNCNIERGMILGELVTIGINVLLCLLVVLALATKNAKHSALKFLFMITNAVLTFVEKYFKDYLESFLFIYQMIIMSSGDVSDILGDDGNISNLLFYFLTVLSFIITMPTPPKTREYGQEQLLKHDLITPTIAQSLQEENCKKTAATIGWHLFDSSSAALEGGSAVNFIVGTPQKIRSLLTHTNYIISAPATIIRATATILAFAINFAFVAWEKYAGPSELSKTVAKWTNRVINPLTLLSTFLLLLTFFIKGLYLLTSIATVTSLAARTGEYYYFHSGKKTHQSSESTPINITIHESDTDREAIGKALHHSLNLVDEEEFENDSDNSSAKTI